MKKIPGFFKEISEEKNNHAISAKIIARIFSEISDIFSVKSITRSNFQEFS